MSTRLLDTKPAAHLIIDVPSRSSNCRQVVTKILSVALKNGIRPLESSGFDYEAVFFSRDALCSYQDGLVPVSASCPLRWQVI